MSADDYFDPLEDLRAEYRPPIRQFGCDECGYGARDCPLCLTGVYAPQPDEDLTTDEQ